MDEALSLLIEFLETASPLVWEVAQKQVQLNIRELYLWAALVGVITVGFLITAIVCTARYFRGDSYDGVNSVGTWVMTAIGIMVEVGIWTALYNRYSNPLWYSIQKLVELIQ